MTSFRKVTASFIAAVAAPPASMASVHGTSSMSQAAAS